jgi:hypothetical protein
MAAVKDVLEQGLTLLREVDPELYRTWAGEPFGASIGGHYRHMLDHFLCVAAGVSAGRIDYDHRTRDRELETSRARAEHITEMLIQNFSGIAPQELGKPCEVISSVGYSGKGPEHIETTLARELAYCVSHAVHHFAIIKLLCAHLSVPAPAGLGVAPSTLEYRRAQAAG